jgi:hypothetical protein
MKLVLASLATGVLVTVGIFITLVFVRALFRDHVSVMFAAWIFVWPIYFVRLLPAVSETALIWLSLAMGILLDTLFFSFVAYCVLRAIVSRQKRVRGAIPPEPPTFWLR